MTATEYLKQRIQKTFDLDNLPSLETKGLGWEASTTWKAGQAAGSLSTYGSTQVDALEALENQLIKLLLSGLWKEKGGLKVV